MRRVKARAAATLLAALAAGAAGAASTPRTVAALPPAQARGFGAALPFDEYEAENGETTGTRLVADRRLGTLAAEASGRRAVRLDRVGQAIALTLARPADALVVRAAVPDSADGRGRDAVLGLWVGQRRVAAVPLTSRYGWFYGRYPFTNRPADGGAHHLFDETRLRLPRRLPANTTLRLVLERDAGVPWVAVDLVDAWLVPPPRPAPAHALPVTSFGADPTGHRPATAAFRAGIAAAARTHRPLWLPPGRYRVTAHLLVDRVRILGAGVWHSLVVGDGVGFYGRAAPGGSQRVELGHFAVLGEVTDRVDELQRNAVGGAMNHSYLHDLWLQHHKVGLWFDGPMHHLRLARLHVTDCTADGVNFHRGVTDAAVTDSFWRNTGDDGIAAWSHRSPDVGVLIRRNTVVLPILANGIAIYGGRDIRVTRNLVADTLTEGGGLHLGNRFAAVPAAKPIRFDHNLLVRTGSVPGRAPPVMGAIWSWALEAPIRGALRLDGNVLIDSTAAGIAANPFRGSAGGAPLSGMGGVG